MSTTLATPSRAARRIARPHTRQRSAMGVLLARYIAGQIAEAEWGVISAALDEAEASLGERTAFAAFCADASAEGAPALPGAGEFEAVLALTRA